MIQLLSVVLYSLYCSLYIEPYFFKKLRLENNARFNPKNTNENTGRKVVNKSDTNEKQQRFRHNELTIDAIYSTTSY